MPNLYAIVSGKNIESLDLPSWSNCIVGEQCGPLQRSKNGTQSIQLVAEKCSISSPKITITKILSNRFSILEDKPGQKLMVTDVRSINQEKPELVEVSDRTMILKLTD